MKYLCLIYDDEKAMGKMPKPEMDAFMGEYFGFTENAKKSGHYLGGNALQPVHTATTVRIRGGKVSTTDGPFAETKEQLGGFWVIECDDLDQALSWAEKCAVACGEPIEVRPFTDAQGK